MFLYEVVDEFDRNKIDYAIVGGYALALHGIVRATVDIDLILRLNKKNLEAAEKIMNNLGLTSRIPVKAHEVIIMREEYIRNRNLIAWSFVDYKNPTRQIDILITKDYSHSKVVKVKVGARAIKVISLEELLAMKEEASRPQDLIDIKAIIEKIDEKKKK